MDFMPLNGRQFPRFSGIKTFYRLPYVTDPNLDFNVAIMGAPSDAGVSYRPGARFAPSAIRDISSLGRSYHWNHDIHVFKKLKCADVGDSSVDPLSIENTLTLIEQNSFDWIQAQKKLLTFGGDHSVTLALLRAFKRYHKTPLNFIHFDAHLDTYPAAWGHEYHHGSFVRHAIEEGLINPSSSLQIGVRGPLAGDEDLNVNIKYNLKYITTDEIKIEGLKEISKKLSHFNGPTYLSFDIDCLDPAYAPGTGTPVPAGLTSFEALWLIRQLSISNLVGADVVEVSPPFDQSQITALLAAQVGHEFLAKML